MKEGKQIKITCPNCKRTDYYKIKPNYCAFCGTSYLTYLKNQKK